MISYKQYIEDLDKILSLDLDWEKLRGQRFLITGANGLIGSSLVDLLLHANQTKQLGLEVTVLVRNKEKALERFKDFDKDAFLQKMAAAVPVPVLNVREGVSSWN